MKKHKHLKTQANAPKYTNLNHNKRKFVETVALMAPGNKFIADVARRVPQDMLPAIAGVAAFELASIRGRRWHSRQELIELPGGGARLRMLLSGLEEIEPAVLSWGTQATVVKPAGLASRIGQIGADLATKYWIGDRATHPPRAEEVASEMPLLMVSRGCIGNPEEPTGQ